MKPISESSALLDGFPHGFFTRLGGMSTGIHSELNCGQRSGDDPASVRENRSRIAAAVGVRAESLLSVRQTHSTHVLIVGDNPIEGNEEADALVTKYPEIAVGILTADCMPILFADPVARVVGAAHAGWRGALAGIVESTVQAMVSVGAVRERILASIGPAISPENYEVGHEFREQFTNTDSASARFFRSGESGTIRFDLPAYGMELLRSSGLRGTELIGQCTYGNPGRYFSYRRSKHRGERGCGLQISVISPGSILE